MGFGGEELLLGGRLFPVTENSTENKFEVYNRKQENKRKTSFFFEDYWIENRCS